METEGHKHPSYGQIRFSRVTGHQRFYGSELEQDHYIELTVQHSEIERELTDDRYYASGKSIIHLRMTSGQFSELITSMNMGEGVCCTLEQIDGKNVEKLPEIENRKEFVHRKFKDRMTEFANRIRKNQLQAKELVKKKTLSKDDVRDLGFQLDWLTTEIENNIPFFIECFQETMDEVILEAKSEVENAILHKITVLGLEKLHEENKLLGK